MIDEQQIRQWVKEGTITSAQAKKMLADSSKEKSDEKSNKFLSAVAIIGAVLIFIGFAWLIAKNWHQIPDAVKTLILVSATLAAFISGVMLRQKNHEGVGRSLISLGALLYILGIFLIAQIYSTPSGLQGYAWLLLLCWPVIIITAYFLDSKENLVIAMIAFFPWVIVQYLASLDHLSRHPAEEGLIFSLILIFLSAGALLFGLSTLHNSLKSKFTNIYRFWTVFYFLVIFYIISFQSFLPLLSEYTFDSSAFSAFLFMFIIICFLGFIIGALFAVRKSSVFLKEILGFVGVLAILFILILSTKAGAGIVGSCYAKNCYSFSNQAECSSAPAQLLCEWETNKWDPQGNCNRAACYNYNTETECNSAADKLNCNWQNNNCLQQGWVDNSAYETCRKYNNQKENCVDNKLCYWQQPIMDLDMSDGLPTSLWLLWMLNNIVFIGFIILILWYGQIVGSAKIINLALFAFVLEIITRYIGFWLDFRGYFAFSVLAILGGLMLIIGAWQIPKLRRKFLEQTKQTKRFSR